MANLVPTGVGSFGRSERSIERETALALSSVRAGGVVTTAREVAKVATVAEVTEAALLATAHISAMEAVLADRSPEAAGRLRYIADAATYGLAEVVYGAHRAYV